MEVILTKKSNKNQTIHLIGSMSFDDQSETVVVFLLRRIP